MALHEMLEGEEVQKVIENQTTRERLESQGESNHFNVRPSPENYQLISNVFTGLRRDSVGTVSIVDPICETLR